MSQSVQICPHCGSQIAFATADIGKQTQCWHCHNLLVIGAGGGSSGSNSGSAGMLSGCMRLIAIILAIPGLCFGAYALNQARIREKYDGAIGVSEGEIIAAGAAALFFFFIAFVLFQISKRR